MKNAIDSAESPAHLCDCGLHVIQVCYVSSQDEQSSRNRSNRGQFADAILFVFRTRVIVQCGFPFCFRRKRGASHKHKTCLKLSRQMFSDGEAQCAQASSDQVDAVALKARMAGPRALVCGGKLKRFKRFNEALACRARRRWSSRGRRSSR